jgi:hypothetical protein
MKLQQEFQRAVKENKENNVENYYDEKRIKALEKVVMALLLRVKEVKINISCYQGELYTKK